MIFCLVMLCHADRLSLQQVLCNEFAALAQQWDLNKMAAVSEGIRQWSWLSDSCCLLLAANMAAVVGDLVQAHGRSV